MYTPAGHYYLISYNCVNYIPTIWSQGCIDHSSLKNLPIVYVIPSTFKIRTHRCSLLLGNNVQLSVS